MGETNNVLKIDIVSVIRSKNPKLLKVIPKFVIRWVEKLIHQNEINDILERFGHLEGVDFASATLKHLRVNYQVHGLEKIEIRTEGTLLSPTIPSEGWTVLY